MAAAVVDAAYLAASFAVPETQLQSLLDNPTAELVASVLGHIESKAREYDDIKAEKLRTDVELENAVRNGDSRARALKASVDKGLKEVEDIRRKLNEEENARARLETELQTLKSSSSNSTSEVQALQSRIATLEASNRDALSLVESKSTAHDKLADELSAQHKKMLALRREVSDLSEKNQALENTSMSTKFREQALQQEVDLLKKNNEYYEGEMQTRNSDHAKFRKEKLSRISELQRLNEDATQTIESLRRTESTLRNRLEEVNQKAEEGFTKIQQLEEDRAKTQESFRAELDSAHRLATLQRQGADMAKSRLQELQSELDSLKDSAGEEIGTLQAEIQTEQGLRLASEAKVEELELQVQNLEASVVEARNTIQQGPTTPRRGINGTLGTPGRLGSPGLFSPGASRLKPSLTSTQLYTENSELRQQLQIVTQEKDKISATMDEMLAMMETKGPELDELRSANERLLNDVGEMSSLLEEANKERELARKNVRKLQGQADGLNRSKQLCEQQLRDLSAQLKLLVVEAQAREQGLESLSAVQQTYLEQVSRGEIDEQHELSDTGRIISRHLVLYRNVDELQTQNVRILNAIRDMEERYEGREASERLGQIEKDREELEKLREKCSKYEEELQTLNDRTKIHIKERDIFRRTLAHRGQLPDGSDLASIFGQSVDGRATATPPPGDMVQSIEQSPQSQSNADYAKLFKEMTTLHDAYKQEMATDLASLKQQVDKLARDKSELQSEVARYTSQMTLAHERYELLQSNFGMLKAENGELQKRSQSLQEVAARQDLLTQKAGEDYVEAKALADSLRNENANLKAERELWKKIEERISEDNRSLLNERSRLNKMISDLQNLQNERELSDSENRRRLQNKVESLETELQSAKRKLDDEREDNKKTAMRREYELEQSRTRIEDFVKSMADVREELVAAKTERDQLQARVDEMKIELRTAEERANTLQPRPTPRTNGITVNEDGLTKEQELELEVSNLKRDLAHARGEVETTKAHIENYKQIAQSSEEDLTSLNETYEQYREEIESTIAGKDARIKDLEQRVDEISSELASTTQELSNVRRTQEESAAAFNQQKEILESDLIRIRDDCERYQETAKMHQEDLKAQAEIAKQAQQSYENELVKHGEATKNLRTMREQYNTLRTEVADIKAQGEAARTTLAQSEEHWHETRQRYERELGELRTRNEDVKSQNKILHEQLEKVGSQIAGLKQSRVSIAGGEEDVAAGSGLESLQEVIKYLRQEKEIVEVQYELSVKEATRYKQQLDQTQNRLDETRSRLSSERQSQADKEKNALSHSNLMKTLEELNLFRESNATLRNEAHQAQARLAEKMKEVDDLMSQLQPLQTRVRELDNALETKNGEYELLQQDRDRYQKRAQDILQKYDRVDPAELEDLKTRLENLQTERDQAVAELQPLQERLNEVEERIRAATEAAVNEATRNFEERRQRLVDQFKTRDKDKTIAINDVKRERDGLQQQVNEIKSELETTKASLEEALTNAKSADTYMQNVEEGQVHEGNSGFTLEEKEALQARINEAEGRANQEANSAVALHIQVGALQGRVRELENEIAGLHQRIAAANNEVAESKAQLQAQAQQIQAQKSLPANQDINGDTSEAIEKLKVELTAAQKEADDLRTSAAIVAASSAAASDGTKSVSEQVAEQVALIRTELEAIQTERVQQAETTFQTRADKMKKALSTKLTEGKETIRQQVRKEHDDAMQQLRSEHETAIQQVKSEHQADVARIQKEAESMIEKAKQEHSITKIEPATSANGATADSGTASDKAPIPWDAPEPVIKDFVANNPTVKSILVRNLQKKLAEEKDSLIAQVKEEQEKICEAKGKEADEAHAKEINQYEMNAKRNTLKISMLENRAGNAQARIIVVQQAAKETPERAVGEVWAIAEQAKAPAKVAPTPPTKVAQPAQPALSAQPANPAPPTESTPVNKPTEPPTQPTQATQATTLTPPDQPPVNQTALQPQPTPIQQPPAQPQQPAFGRSAFGQVPQGTFGQPTGQPQNTFGNRPPGSFGQPAQLQAGQPPIGQPMQPNLFGQHANMTQNMPGFNNQNSMGRSGPTFGVPGQNQMMPNQMRPNSPAQQFPQANQFRQHIGGQGPQTSIPRGGGLPRPVGRGQGNSTQPNQGAGNQGSQLPRGGGGAGRRGGRGGPQHIQTSNVSQGVAGQGSPKGAMNPAAKQFNPGSGQKRAREDGGDGGDAGHQGGKRPRGGAGGGN